MTEFQHYLQTEPAKCRDTTEYVAIVLSGKFEFMSRHNIFMFDINFFLNFAS